MRALGIFQDIGPLEIIIILVLALLLFGAKRLPEIGRSLGRGIKEFKTGVKGLGDDVKAGMESDDAPTGQSTPKKSKGKADS